MAGSERRAPAYRFGVFELDMDAGELRKYGIRIKLQEQPRQILQLLVEHAGDTVTRDVIQKQIWPDKTFVDFDNAINSAVRKLREALGDKADNPRFIETLARRGYRFLAPVSTIGGTSPETSTAEPAVVARRSGPILAGSILLAACALALAIWLGRKNNLGEYSEIRVSTLTANAGIEIQPSFSPDGTRVVYAFGGPDGKLFSTYTKLIGAGDPVQLTNDGTRDLSPAWSPDGRWIAILRDLGREFAVLLIPASGGHYRELTRVLTNPDCSPTTVDCGLDVRGAMLAWSADGRFLFTSGRTPPSHALRLLRVSVDDGEQQPVLQEPEGISNGDVEPAVSPDGHSLAFVRLSSLRRGDLYVAPISGDRSTVGEPKRITSDNADLGAPAWTASGQELVFSSNRAGRRELWRVRVSASANPVRVAGAGENASDVAVSPRGGRLIYGRSNNFGSIWRIPLEQGKGGRPIRVTETTARITYPHFSPDGTRIAFQSGRSGVNEIWLCDANGANMVPLTAFGRGESGSPRWSPDGRAIAFDSNADGNWDIYVVRSDGGHPFRVTRSQGNIVPNWSRDGLWIYYTAIRGRNEVWKIHPDGTSETKVTLNGGSFAAESANGEYLYYKDAESNSAIWRMPVMGGAPTKILEGIRGRLFTLSEHGVYFPAGNPVELRFLDFASGSIRVVGALGGIPFAAVSDDERSVLFTRNEFWGTNLMVVDNFR